MRSSHVAGTMPLGRKKKLQGPRARGPRKVSLAEFARCLPPPHTHPPALKGLRPHLAPALPRDACPYRENPAPCCAIIHASSDGAAERCGTPPPGRDRCRRRYACQMWPNRNQGMHAHRSYWPRDVGPSAYRGAPEEGCAPITGRDHRGMRRSLINRWATRSLRAPPLSRTWGEKGRVRPTHCYPPADCCLKPCLPPFPPFRAVP